MNHYIIYLIALLIKKLNSEELDNIQNVIREIELVQPDIFFLFPIILDEICTST